MALGLGVSPGKLNELPAGNEAASGYITVMNTNNTTTRYRVYVQGKDCRDSFKIEPSEFLLQPGANKKVEIRFQPANEIQIEEQIYICVVILPASGGLGIGAGIRVPVSFNGM